jgi:hypothetical protein
MTLRYFITPPTRRLCPGAPGSYLIVTFARTRLPADGIALPLNQIIEPRHGSRRTRERGYTIHGNVRNGRVGQLITPRCKDVLVLQTFDGFESPASMTCCFNEERFKPRIYDDQLTLRLSQTCHLRRLPVESSTPGLPGIRKIV